MAETARLGLPLLAGAQAQKHVTVNEALARLDALGHLRIASRMLTSPPPAVEGIVYAVPGGAGGDWTGEDGRLAIALNGGWVFVTPGDGWRAWIADEGTDAIFAGGAWIAGGVAVTGSGAGCLLRSVETDHVLTAGTTSVTMPLIPDGSVVFGVTGRVLAEVTGSASFRIGVPGADDRYGSGIGTSAGSWLRGVTGQPLAYYADTALVITAEGGSFAGGMVRLAVHFAVLTLPEG